MLVLIMCYVFVGVVCLIVVDNVVGALLGFVAVLLVLLCCCFVLVFVMCCFGCFSCIDLG